ncbi:MAG: hypothetical protein ACRDY0_08185, partial [Acidimicrobiales bacterium]
CDGWADLVAGSRHRERAGAGGLAGPWRRAVSGGSRRLVHALLPRSRCLADPMSGLFALDRSVIAGVGLRANGFKILLEVVVRGRPRRVHNLDYHFARRHAGQSKARPREGARFLSHLGRLVLDGPSLRDHPPAGAAVAPDGGHASRLSIESPCSCQRAIVQTRSDSRLR